MRSTPTSSSVKVVLASDPPTPDIHEVTINVADWFGHRKGNIERDERNENEFGWHAKQDGALVEVKFPRTPAGQHPRILRYFADVYGMFTGRMEGQDGVEFTPGARAVALHSMQSKNNFDFGHVSVANCPECLMWLQTPVGYDGAARHVERSVGHLPASLLTHDALWMKLSMFANPGADELLLEMTVSLEFIYEAEAV